ncbi:hypothetical protein PENARI_c046G00962 [Penicillium arizonense]|uniref:PA domain-containing protein n=1 Tax=Penicillium arizonense TaxID=1835702 RepID=A0A1F5L2V9_PENAI|nr:hypothetical protein PENARI_c046G00962 [Penicillium arizonense]OGE47387.1 hypothetical protein PENARI_c046G00962 [Penicillium arizonense]
MPYGPFGNVTGDLAVIPNLGCGHVDFPADVTGKLAVISPGTCTFSDKSTLAGASNAAVAIIYNNVDGNLSGTLGSPTNSLGPYVPTVGISKAAGDALVAKLAGASITGALSVNTQSENVKTDGTFGGGVNDPDYPGRRTKGSGQGLNVQQLDPAIPA